MLQFLIGFLILCVIFAVPGLRKAAFALIAFAALLLFVWYQSTTPTAVAPNPETLAEAALQEVLARSLSSEVLNLEIERRGRHILLPSEQDALRVREDILRGQKFAIAAQMFSTDPAAKTTGGDLGFCNYAQLPRTFADVMFRLKLGEVSPPVKTQFGWHLILVEAERRKTPLQPEAATSQNTSPLPTAPPK